MVGTKQKKDNNYTKIQMFFSLLKCFFFLNFIFGSQYCSNIQQCHCVCACVCLYVCIELVTLV